MRLQVFAKPGQRLLEIAILLRGPSLLRDEESVLDRIACDPRFSFGSPRAGRARGVAPIGSEPALREGEWTAPDIRGRDTSGETDGTRCHSVVLLEKRPRRAP